MDQNRIDALVDQYYWNAETQTGHNWAATIALVLRDYFELETDCLPEAANAFGGGLAGTHRSLCGGLTGGMIMIGLLYNGKANDLAEPFLQEFRSVYGSDICCEVIGIDFDDEDDVAQNKDRTAQEICKPMLKRMSAWLAEHLENQPEPELEAEAV